MHLEEGMTLETYPDTRDWNYEEDAVWLHEYELMIHGYGANEAAYEESQGQGSERTDWGKTNNGRSTLVKCIREPRPAAKAILPRNLALYGPAVEFSSAAQLQDDIFGGSFYLYT